MPSFIEDVLAVANGDTSQLTELHDIARYQLCHEVLRGESKINNMRSLGLVAKKRVVSWKSWTKRNADHKRFDIEIYNTATKPKPPGDTLLDLEVFKYCLLISTGQKVMPTSLEEIQDKFNTQLELERLEQEKNKKEALKQDKLRLPFKKQCPALNNDEIDGLLQRLENIELVSEHVKEVTKSGKGTETRVQVTFSNKTKESMLASTLSGHYKSEYNSKHGPKL